MGFGLVIRFIEHLHNSLLQVTIALSLIHTSHITLGHVRRSHSLVIFSGRCWVAVSNGGRSPFSVGSQTVPVPQLPASHSSSSQRLSLAVL
jgi:hypothetical protein